MYYQNLTVSFSARGREATQILPTIWIITKNGALCKRVADLWRIIWRQQLRLVSIRYVERGHYHINIRPRAWFPSTQIF